MRPEGSRNFLDRGLSRDHLAVACARADCSSRLKTAPAANPAIARQARRGCSSLPQHRGDEAQQLPLRRRLLQHPHHP